MSKLDAAMKKHGNVFDVCLMEHFEMWPIDEAMRLLVMMMREIAKRERRYDDMERAVDEVGRI